MHRFKHVVLTVLRSLASFAAGYTILAITNMAFVLAIFAGGSGDPSATIVIIGIPYTIACTFLAGWVTAVIAPSRKLIHSAVVGLAMGAVIAGSIVADVSIEPSWYKVGYLVIQVPATLVGGFLAARRHNRFLSDVH